MLGLGTVGELAGGRGADGVVDVVGMGAHGSPLLDTAVKAAGLPPDVIAEPLTATTGLDRLAALHTAIKSVRRGGTVSVCGVDGGEPTPWTYSPGHPPAAVGKGARRIRHVPEETARRPEGTPETVNSVAQRLQRRRCTRRSSQTGASDS